MSRTRLGWAQWFCEKGITTFIVDANSKRPLGGTSWYIRNTTDPEQIAEWFDMTPNCNWGLWLGSEYVAIDLDVKHDTEGVTGIAAFDAICRENGIENWLLEFETLMVDTPSRVRDTTLRTLDKPVMTSSSGWVTRRSRSSAGMS